MADATGFLLEMDEYEYRIVGPGGEEGAETEYGEVAVLRVDGAVYYAIVEDPNEPGQFQIYRVDSVSAVGAEVEDVTFAGEGAEEQGAVIDLDAAGATVVNDDELEDDPEDDEEDDEDEDDLEDDEDDEEEEVIG